MARTWREIDAAKLEAETANLEASVQGYPPGFVEGGELTLNASAQVEMAPIALQVGSRNVQINETVIINEEHWNIGGQTTNRLASHWYSIYISELGTIHVAHLEAEFDSNLYGYYHPSIARHRGVGRFYVDASSVITRVAHLGPHRLTITDDLDRYIEISADAGLYAEDASGNIIHDIPDVPITSGMVYGGHIIWVDAPDYISQIALVYTDIENAYGETSAITNVNISSEVGGCTNVKGALVAISSAAYITATKVLAASTAQVTNQYCVTYNTFPAYGFNHFAGCRTVSQVAGVYIDNSNIIQAAIPVTYDSGIPYISWFSASGFTNMASANAAYGTVSNLYMQGFFV